MLNDLLASESETIEIECPSIEPERVHDQPEIEPEVEPVAEPEVIQG